MYLANSELKQTGMVKQLNKSIFGGWCPGMCWIVAFSPLNFILMNDANDCFKEVGGFCITSCSAFLWHKMLKSQHPPSLFSFAPIWLCVSGCGKGKGSFILSVLVKGISCFIKVRIMSKVTLLELWQRGDILLSELLLHSTLRQHKSAYMALEQEQ